VEDWIGFIPFLLGYGGSDFSRALSLIQKIMQGLTTPSHVLQLVCDEKFMLSLKKNLSNESTCSDSVKSGSSSVVAHLLTIDPTILSLESFEWLEWK
jgi:hypothetical protein